jgi:hypothetical protein
VYLEILLHLPTSCSFLFWDGIGLLVVDSYGDQAVLRNGEVTCCNTGTEILMLVGIGKKCSLCMGIFTDKNTHIFNLNLKVTVSRDF